MACFTVTAATAVGVAVARHIVKHKENKNINVEPVDTLKTSKKLGILEIALFGGSFILASMTLMWLIDCIASAIKGEGFLSFEIPVDIWISIWTVVGGLIFYGVMFLILYLKDRKAKVSE